MKISDMKSERRFDDSISSLSSFEYMVEFCLLKLINNSSSLNKGNHEGDDVWINITWYEMQIYIWCLLKAITTTLKKWGVFSVELKSSKVFNLEPVIE